MRQLALLVAVVLASAAVHAQPVLAPGDRVRVTMPDERLTGTVLAVGADTLVVEAGPLGLATSVLYSDVTALDVRVRRSRGRGAARGALVGAGVAVVLTLGTAAAIAEPESMGPAFVLILIGPLIVLPASVAVGAVVGALLPGGRWEPVADGSVALRVGALGTGGGGVRLQIRL